MDETTLQCACGKTKLVVKGAPIASVECCCASCQDAGRRFEHLPQARPVLTAYGATPFVLYRKDRVIFLSGIEGLKAHRLSKEAATRRVVASCCNTPMFLEFKGGHWLSIYGMLWPNGSRPPLVLRTVTKDVEWRNTLPNDAPNAKEHTLSFYGKLFKAWAAMGFRSPGIEIKGEFDA